MPHPRAWEAGDHLLGRGAVRPENVKTYRDGVRLVLPANRPDGAEIRSPGRFGYGTYTARIRTPRAPGSLTAFFLYEDVAEGNDEIDIEIFNDDTRRVLLTAWIDGVQLRTDTLTLAFDPAEDAHEYTIDHRPAALRFLIDGEQVAAWTGRLPRRPMRLMLNAWWPVWLSDSLHPEPRAARVEWVRW